MRKFLLSFFSVLVLALCRPSVVFASGLVIDPQSIATTQYGAQALFDLSFLDEGLFSSSGWEGFTHGGVVIEDIFTFDSSDFSISELNNDQKIELMESVDLYNRLTDSEGYAPFQSNQTIYIANFDNGFFTGQAYLDSNGNILANSPSLDNSLITYTFGGSEFSLDDFISLVDDVSSDVISSPSLTINDRFNPVSDVSYFYWRGSSYHSQPSSAWSLYIANQYQPGIIVPVTSATGAGIGSWYANSLSPFVYTQTHYYQNDTQYTENQFSYSVGNYSKNGYSYRYQVTFGAFVGGYSQNGVPVINSYDDWVNGRTSSVAYWFAQTGINYDPSKDGTGKTFNPYLVVNGNTILLDDPYSYGSISDTYDSTSSVIPERNTDFDNTQDVTDSNFPIYYPTDVTLTDSFPYPIELDPSVEFPLEGTIEESTVMGSFMESDLPFFTNLKYRFPFSIPWDLYDCLKQIDNLPTAPAWDFDYTITVLNHNYTYHFEGDLSDFDELARIFRLLERIAFLVFLAFFSYKQFF